jgi:hypothetical protein
VPNEEHAEVEYSGRRRCRCHGQAKKRRSRELDESQGPGLQRIRSANITSADSTRQTSPITLSPLESRTACAALTEPRRALCIFAPALTVVDSCKPHRRRLWSPPAPRTIHQLELRDHQHVGPSRSRSPVTAPAVAPRVSTPGSRAHSHEAA